MRLLLLSLLLVLSGCASTPQQREFDPNDYFLQIRDGLEFKTTPRETYQFFQDVKNSKGRVLRDSDQVTEVLGENLSTAVLLMDKEISDRLSVQVGSDQAAFARTMNERVSRGLSLVMTGDVRGATDLGEFVRVRLEVPGMLTGYVYVKKNPIEGRTPAEQTFLDYYRQGQPPQKLSVSALILLLKKS